MKETTEIVLAAVSLANGIGAALGDDGKLDISDTVYLMDFIMARSYALITPKLTFATKELR